MSVIGSESRSNADGWDDEAIRILDRLDADNEHYMLVNIELRDLLEDAVTREVGLEKRVDSLVAEVASSVAEAAALRGERDAMVAENGSLLREAGDLRAHLARLEAEIVAIHSTKVMRAAAPFRSFYARVRRLRG